jgi:hypothetical protein
MIIVAHAHFLDAVGAMGPCVAGCARVRRHFLVVSADFTDNVVEGVVNVDAGFGRGFDEFAAKVLGEVLALCDGAQQSQRVCCKWKSRGKGDNAEGSGLKRVTGTKHTLCGNLPLAVEIALVAYHNHGEIVLVLYAQNLLLERHDFLKALAVGYRVDE